MTLSGILGLAPIPAAETTALSHFKLMAILLSIITGRPFGIQAQEHILVKPFGSRMYPHLCIFLTQRVG